MLAQISGDFEVWLYLIVLTIHRYSTGNTDGHSAVALQLGALLVRGEVADVEDESILLFIGSGQQFSPSLH